MMLCDVLQVQGGGDVWRYSGIDGKNGNDYADFYPNDNSRFDGRDSFCSVCMRCSLRVN
jgi:hypothetical protein